MVIVRTGLLSFILAAVVAALIWFFGYPINEWQSWLLAISLITLLVFGYDKSAARSDRKRIPEVVLLALTLTGGSVGAAVGMFLFRHKIRKTGFLIRVLAIVVLQIVLLAILYLVLNAA